MPIRTGWYDTPSSCGICNDCVYFNDCPYLSNEELTLPEDAGDEENVDLDELVDDFPVPLFDQEDLWGGLAEESPQDSEYIDDMIDYCAQEVCEVDSNLTTSQIYQSDVGTDIVLPEECQ